MSSPSFLSRAELSEQQVLLEDLEKISAALGLKFNDEDAQMVRVLTAVRNLQLGQGRASSPAVPSSSSPPGPLLAQARAIAAGWEQQQQRAKTKSDDDLGDVVLARMRERRGLPLLGKQGGR